MHMRKLVRASQVLIVLTTLGSAAIAASARRDGFYVLPNDDGLGTAPSENVGRLPSEPIRVGISGIERFDVDPAGVEPHRPDLFCPGHLSVFDLIAHLGSTGRIGFVSHYGDSMGTHVIDSIDGVGGGWYEARHDSGWFERNITRMDAYPVKDGVIFALYTERPSELERLCEAFAEETARLESHDSEVSIPLVELKGGRGRVVFENVSVTAHGVRSDLWQPGAITAFDILLSLGEQGELTRVGLQWYDSIAGADPFDDCFSELLEADGFLVKGSGGCGLVYEVGYNAFHGFAGSHIRIARLTCVPSCLPSTRAGSGFACKEDGGSRCGSTTRTTSCCSLPEQSWRSRLCLYGLLSPRGTARSGCFGSRSTSGAGSLWSWSR